MACLPGRRSHVQTARWRRGKLEFGELFANVIGSPWGELSPVRRLRGVCTFYAYESVILGETPLRHRYAMPPLPKERHVRKAPLQTPIYFKLSSLEPTKMVCYNNFRIFILF